MRSSRGGRLYVICWLLVGCDGDAVEKIDALGLDDSARAALSRLRFSPLREGDRLGRGDVVLCSGDDRVALAFSRRLMTEYLGIDAEVLLPELFVRRDANEVFWDVEGGHLMRLALPEGVGATVGHPEARVRQVVGTPLWSGDLRTIDLLFAGREMFASRTVAAPTGAPKPTPARSWRIGVVPFPRMGPKSGVVIAEVIPGSPAEKAKLRAGDTIVAVAGQPVGDMFELKTALTQAEGPSIALAVKRAGSRLAGPVTVQLAE